MGQGESSNHVCPALLFAHAHASPHRHRGLQLQAVGRWQPQVQVDPRQVSQRQTLAFTSFMMFSNWVRVEVTTSQIYVHPAGRA
jgi:hypothetical protein